MSLVQWYCTDILDQKQICFDWSIAAFYFEKPASLVNLFVTWYTDYFGSTWIACPGAQSVKDTNVIPRHELASSADAGSRLSVQWGCY